MPEEESIADPHLTDADFLRSTADWVQDFMNIEMWRSTANRLKKVADRLEKIEQLETREFSADG